MNNISTITPSCPKCAASNTSNVKYQDTTDFRGLEFDVEGLDITKCLSCGHLWETKEQKISNQELIKSTYGTHRDRLRTEQGLLTGAQIADIRNSISLTQRQASLIFGGGYNSFNKYESGEVLQSVAMDRLLKLVYLFKRPALRILENLSSNNPIDIFQYAALERPKFISLAINSGNSAPLTIEGIKTVRNVNHQISMQKEMHPRLKTTTYFPE